MHPTPSFWQFFNKPTLVLGDHIYRGINNNIFGRKFVYFTK